VFDLENNIQLNHKKKSYCDHTQVFD